MGRAGPRRAPHRAGARSCPTPPGSSPSGQRRRTPRTHQQAEHGDRPFRPRWRAMPCPRQSPQRSPWRQRRMGRGIRRGHASLRSQTPPPARTPAGRNVRPAIGLLQLVRNSVQMVTRAYPVVVDLEVELRTHGYRVTTARRAVWDVLSATGDHLTAPSITSRVHAVDPSINGASVYRALTLFAELGLVRESATRMRRRGSRSTTTLPFTSCAPNVDG